jgi:hypothetical protein
LAGHRGGLLTEQVSHLLAHGFSQLSLEGRIGLGQRFGQVAQIMRLTKLMGTVGQNGGHGRYQTRLFVAEHRKDGPFQRCERFEEGFKRGLILLAKPATS